MATADVEMWPHIKRHGCERKPSPQSQHWAGPVWGFPCLLPSLLHSAGIQTVKHALCQQVGSGRLLRNNGVTGCLTKLHFKLRSVTCVIVQPVNVSAPQRILPLFLELGGYQSSIKKNSLIAFRYFCHVMPFNWKWVSLMFGHSELAVCVFHDPKPLDDGHEMMTCPESISKIYFYSDRH